VKIPKISVITPSYNQGEFIEETILSIINQNYPNLEYIIIDGGSSDRSTEIIQRYESYLSFWVSEKDRGQSHAINKGFMKATGDIICWINSDDILMPNALQKVAEFFNSNEDVDFLNGHLLIIDKHSKIISNYFILNQKDFYARSGIYYVAQQSMFWRRKLFDQIGFLKEDFHALMDREFLIRILRRNKKIGQLNEILAGIRKHEATKTALNGTIWSRDASELNRLYGNSYGRKNPNLTSLILYGLEKVLKGIYFKKVAFILKWKGKHINELTKAVNA